MTEHRRPQISPADILAAMRPSQWTKNVVVLAAFFFAFWDHSRANPLGLADLFVAIGAAVLFCIVSSGIYVLNDIRDVNADQNHPLKRLRPLAAGRLSRTTAWWMTLILLSGGCAGSYLLSVPFAGIVASYVLIQCLYSLGLKQIALIDILMIAIGFVLRAMAGAVVLAVNISPWLLVCTFLLALFLALCKRRHEKLLLNDAINEHRPSLEKYSEQLLDQLVNIAASATVVSYAIYTLWPQTIEKFGTDRLALTIPFVVFGIFRYLYLVYHHDGGGRPEKILLTDIPLLADIGIYGASVILIFVLQ